MPKQSLLERVENFYRQESEGALKLMDDVIRRAKRQRAVSHERKVETEKKPAMVLPKLSERPVDSKPVTS